MNFVLEAYTLSECMELMAERVEKYELEGRKNFIFCEDRLTLIAERALTRRTGGTFLSSVTTFARFLKTEEKIISKQGSVMAVGGIMASLQKANALRCFTSPSAIENSAKVVYETIAQLAASEVTPDTLQESATLLEGDVLKDKVCDLALIYREYSAFLVEKGYLDESKYLSLLPDRIRAESSLRGANIIFLGFTSFTAQALKSVRAAIETAKDVVGIFCAGEEELYTNRARDVFLRTCEEYAKAEIRKLGTPIGGEAEILRKGLYAMEGLGKNKTLTDRVSVFEASDLTDEAEYVAVQIKKRLSEGYRYRDFAVLVPDSAYSLPLRRAFTEFKIPFFFDEKKSLKKHPLSGFLLSALEVVRERFSPVSVQELAQNAFFGESDEYRNYLLKYGNFRGGALKELRENDVFDMEAVASGKERLLRATKNIKWKGQGREFCAAIRKLIEDFKVEERLEELKAQTQDEAIKGYLSQIFTALQRVLAEAELLTADATMTVVEFQGILSEGLDATEISLIPLKQDAVFVGDISSSRIEKVGVLFAVGMTEDVPRNSQDTALVSDRDIEKLAEVKTLLEPSVAQVNLRTRESVCLNLCTFTDRLYLSYPMNADGSMPTLSEILRYVRGLFRTENGELRSQKGLSDEDFAYYCSEPLPALRRRYVEHDLYASSRADTRERALSLSEALTELKVTDGLGFSRKEETEIERGEELFFKDGKISPTALETYFSCPFKNFMKQGLRLKEREETLVLAVDTGNFVHEVLENLSANIDKIPDETAAAEYAEKVGQELLLRPLYAAQTDTASGKYSAQSLLNEGKRVAVAVYRQITGSEFKVEGIEKSISTPEFNGKIDRMDGTDRFVRIIDYKTGAVKAEPVEYYTGRKIQIQLYMNAVQGDRVPAGVYYFPASSDYKTEEEQQGRFRMLGYMNGDVSAIRAGDKSLSGDGKSEFFDARLEDNKRLDKVMDEEVFRDFLSYANLVAKGAREELKEGFVAATPYDGVCAVCKFGGACGRNQEAISRKCKDVSSKRIAEIVERERTEKEDE